MYLVIRCPGCGTFSYVDRFQKWRLCPVCGGTINVRKAPVYLETKDYHDAEMIIGQLEKYLHDNKKTDLTSQELNSLRTQYSEWFKQKV